MVTDNQTLNDLEFTVVRQWLEEYAIGETAKERLQSLTPSSSVKEIINNLSASKELKDIRDEGHPFPLLQFEELKSEIKLLPIKNSSIDHEGFIRLKTASQLVNQLIHFFDKEEKNYPIFSDLLSQAEYTLEIIQPIDKVFDKFGKVKDEASEQLSEIRRGIQALTKQINRNFDKEKRRLSKDNMLGDTTETFINERRVLTVLSNYKRKVEGTVLGSSNTGNLTYIEPKINIGLNNELELLIDDERKEIFRILQELKRELLDFLPLIKTYQSILTEIDFINAKTKLAQLLDCNMPSIMEDTELELIDVFHPILKRANDLAEKKTIPQHVKMDKFSRMLVISGPNAGGKSITLKSVGLIQVMLQSGLLVPLHSNSKMAVFQKIYSDIGDNQSISDELSTYSYRLKRMNAFLSLANRKSLFLIDEFGTGSDPDLGGALAEVIFEELYNKKSYGVITTHYNNIKLKADQLRNACNGSMLFNTDTLEPMYVFSTGQPGSSFTFEVAKTNGIPTEIIEEAKNRLHSKKVQLDDLLNKLQEEKNYLSRLNQEHIEAQDLAAEAYEEFTSKRKKLEDKLAEIRSSREKNARFLNYGKKMDQFISKYNLSTRKKSINDKLVEDVKKYIAVEKSKLEEAKKISLSLKKSQQANKKKKKSAPIKIQYNRDKIKVGSRVKLIATRQAGTVEEINQDTITVMFGYARMKVDRNRLMWVQGD